MRSSSKVFVGKFEAVCTGFIWLVSHGISLEWLKASGGVLFLSTDIFKAETALSKPSYSFPSITQHDPFLEKINKCRATRLKSTTHFFFHPVAFSFFPSA